MNKQFKKELMIGLSAYALGVVVTDHIYKKRLQKYNKRIDKLLTKDINYTIDLMNENADLREKVKEQA